MSRMNASAWLFSAKRLWQSRPLRWAIVFTGALLSTGTAFFFVRMIPLSSPGESVIVHYNIYLGIDEVRPRFWVFLLPLFWWSLTLFDIILACGRYRLDPHWAGSLVYLGLAWSIPWFITLYYLTLVNV